MLVGDGAVGEEFVEEEPQGEGGAGEHAEAADRSEEVERARHVFEEEADGEEVEEDAEGAGDAVVAFAGGAGGVGDADLADGRAVPGGEGGDEAVHFAVERDVLDDFAAVGLEGGAEVVDGDAGEGGHQLVGGAGGDASEKEVVAAFGAPTADDVVAFLEFGEEAGDLVGVVLEVAVHGEDELALRVVEAGGEGGGLAEVAAEFDDEDARIDGGDLFKEAVGAVAGAVVDEDEFKGLARVGEHGFHDGFEAVVEGGDVFFFVVEGDDDGELRHGSDHTPLAWGFWLGMAVDLGLKDGSDCGRRNGGAGYVGDIWR